MIPEFKSFTVHDQTQILTHKGMITVHGLYVLKQIPDGFEPSDAGKNCHKSLTVQNGFAIPARRPTVTRVQARPESPGVRFSELLSGYECSIRTWVTFYSKDIAYTLLTRSTLFTLNPTLDTIP